VGKQ